MPTRANQVCPTSNSNSSSPRTAGETDRNAMGDGGSDDFVFEMDLNCVVQKQIPVPIDPYDVEDLAVSGRTLVLSDTGDNLRTRETVAFITMDLDSGDGTLHRLTYPDGAHDTESIPLSCNARLKLTATSRSS